MTQSRTPPTKPSIPVPRRAPTDSTPPQDEIPRGEFIDVVSHKPVEPARLQVFPVPKEFLNKVRANKPPQLRPDDIKDTVPHGLPRQRVSEPAPANATTRIAASNEPQRPSAAPKAKTQPPRAGTGARAQRPPSALTVWALTGRIPGRIKIAVATVLGGLLLLLLWENWNADDSGADNNSDPMTSPSAVPLLDAPAVVDSAATAPTESPVVAQQQAPSVATGDAPTSSPEPARISEPTLAANKPKAVSNEIAKAGSHLALPAVAPKKSDESASPKHSAAAPATARPTITPLFEPR